MPPIPPSADAAPGLGPTGGALPRARVWVVDDSPLEAKRALALLTDVYAVDMLSDGGALLERLAQDGPLPHLVLLDWNMPGVSGEDALGFLRARFDEASLPVLVLTASTERADVARALDAGANDFVTKPYVPQELLARVRTLTRMRQQADAARALAEATHANVEAQRARLQESEERLRRVVEASGTGTWELDVATGRVTTDARHLALMGLPPGVAATYAALFEAVHPEDRARAQQRIEAALAGEDGGRYHDEFRAMGPAHAGARWVEVRGHALFDAGGRALRLIGTSLDVTERRAAEDALRLREAELRAHAAQEKERAAFEQQLIGIVSHDLRNPIAAILMGAAVLLRRPDVEERQRRTVERILTSAGRANRMVHDLLDFTQARLGSGLTAVRVPGDVHAVVRQVVDESQVSNPGRVVRLTQAGDGQGAWDADRLAQLVGNLLSNALRYGLPDAPVHVETRGLEDAVVLSVHNAGAPIAAELLPRLFQPMQRGVTEVSEVRSVGLGLYIVDQVVRAHAGTVEVASTAEAGTTFTVRLPRGG